MPDNLKALMDQPAPDLLGRTKMRTPGKLQSQKGKEKNVQQSTAMKTGPAFVFDLDGTLVDSVYQHVLAWREALEQLGIELAVWRIHRRIGMSGGLLVNALLREIGRRLTRAEAARLPRLHHEAYLRQIPQIRALPGASDLLACLSRSGIPWAIATCSRLDSARPVLAACRREKSDSGLHG